MAPPKISDEEIIEIQSLYDKGSNIPQIQEKTGKSSSVIDKYIKADRIKPKIPTVPPTAEPPTTTEPTTATPEQPTHVILEPAEVQPQEALPPIVSPYPEIPEPEEWLKSFLDGYRLKPQFVQGQYSRVKRRNTLPTPQDLMSDLQVGDSGQKNILMIRDIVEDYDFAVEEYMNNRKQIMQMPATRRRGIPLDRGQPPIDYTRGGIPIRNPPVQYDQYGHPYQQYGRQPEYDPYGRPYDDRREGIPLQPMQQNAPPYPRLEGELERYARIQQLFQKTEERNPVTDRLEKENDALSQRLQEMETSMKNQMIAENQQLRTQIQQQGQAMRQYEDNLREANMKLQFEQSNKRVTEEDVKMKEIDNKYNLENKRLDEGGKTREAIANAVKTGFSQVGQAIFATAQELGSEEKRPMQGFTDTKNMWQSKCPFCSTTITAPLSARILTCPGCGKQLEVSPPTPERPIERPQTASFTVEQPPLEPPDILPPKVIEQTVEPPRVSECPFCKTPLTIPIGLDIVECPRCKKRLRVEAEVPTQVPEEIPTEVPVQVPKEIHVESPPSPEIITEPQPVKGQIIEQPIVPEPYVAPDTTIGETPVSELIDKKEPERFPKAEPTPDKKIAEEKFTPEEKEKIDKSLQDAKEGRITPLKIEEEEPILERPKHKLESIKKLEEELEEKADPEVQKIAEGIAIGEATDKLEEELKKEKVEEEKEPFTKDGYTLFKTNTKSGTPFYYFGKTSKAGTPCFEIPEGRELGVNPKTGLPILRKKKE